MIKRAVWFPALKVEATPRNDCKPVRIYTICRTEQGWRQGAAGVVFNEDRIQAV